MSQKTPKKICIIQLSRFGDVVQTLLALKNFKDLHPNIELTLCAREKFSEPFKSNLLEVVKDLITIPTNPNYIEICKFLKYWKLQFFDVAINFSYLPSSSILLSLTNSKFKLGGQMDINGNINITDTWGQFIYSIIMKGPHSPFNLVDLFQLSLGTPPFFKIEKEKSLSKKDNYIVINPFASIKKKFLDYEFWVKTINAIQILLPSIKIYIIGSHNEENLAEKITNSFDHNVINNCGKNSIKEALRLIKNSLYFIGHDSLAGHLSSYAQTDSLTITLGPSRAIETCPYGINNLIVTPIIECFPCNIETPCHSLPCHQLIPPEAIAQIVFLKLTHKSILDFEEKINEVYCDKNLSFNILSTYFIDQVGLFYKSLTSSYDSLELVFHKFYFIIWNFLLRDFDVKFDLPRIDNYSFITLNKCMNLIELYYELLDHLKKNTQILINETFINPGDKIKIKTLVEKLTEIDNQFIKLSNSMPLLSPLFNFFYVRRMQINENSLEKMYINILDIIDENINAIKIFYELGQKTIEKHKKEIEHKFELKPDH